MNTGMQDAINLSWKLAMVVRGEKPDSFLNSYSVERHRVGENLLKGTDKLFELIATTNPIYLCECSSSADRLRENQRTARLFFSSINLATRQLICTNDPPGLRNTLVPWIVPFIMGKRERRAQRLRFVSQLGIRYRHSPIVGTGTGYGGHLRGGDRAPDGKLVGENEETSLHGLCVGTSHQLILFSGIGGSDEEINPVAAEFLEQNIGWLRVHKVLGGVTSRDGCFVDLEAKLHKTFGFQEAGYCLIRPDGYIAHVGSLSRMDGLRTWLKD